MRIRGSYTTISDSLARRLWSTLPAPKPPPNKPPKVARGPKAVSVRMGGPPKYPDELILEIRRLHEYMFLGPKRIYAHLSSLGVNIKLGTLHNYVEYRTKSHLVPEQRDKPYWPTAQKGVNDAQPVDNQEGSGASPPPGSPEAL